MRRWLLVAGVVGTGTLFLSLRDRGPEVRTGWWRGVTSQGLPIELHVDERDGGLVVDKWRMIFELTCERSGQLLRGGLGANLELPIRERRFEGRVRSPMWWDEWSGTFGDDAAARGTVDAVWAALFGASIDALAPDKCSARGLTFVAHARAGEAAPTGAPLDLELSVAGDGSVSVVRAP